MKGQRDSHGKVSAAAAGRGIGGGMKGGEASSPAAVEKEAEGDAHVFLWTGPWDSSGV